LGSGPLGLNRIERRAKNTFRSRPNEKRPLAA